MPEAVGKDTTTDRASQHEAALSLLYDEMDDFVAMTEALNTMIVTAIEAKDPLTAKSYGIHLLQRMVMDQFQGTWSKAKAKLKEAPAVLSDAAERFVAGQAGYRDSLFRQISSEVAVVMRHAGRDLPGDDPKAWSEAVREDHSHLALRLYTALADRVGTPGVDPAMDRAVYNRLLMDLTKEMLSGPAAADDPATKRAVDRLSDAAPRAKGKNTVKAG